MLNAKRFTLRGKAVSLKNDMPFEIKPFLNLVLSLEQNLRSSIPVLSDLAALAAKTDSPGGGGSLLREGYLSEGILNGGIIYRRLNRHYLRLCRVTGELDRLDLNKVAPYSLQAFSLEDFVFSNINFSRYREINEKDFGLFIPEALDDFSEEFFRKNFGFCRVEVQTVIEGSYKKTQGQFMNEGKYEMIRENPLILSIMRTLETSLENSPLFTIGEIQKEVEKLPGLSGKRIIIPEMNTLYHLIVLSLNNTSVTHEDGMVTKLLVSRERELTGIFRPGNKPWTRVLIPNLTNN